uniref:Spherulation-specific family 4 n=1 Tax=Panagrolaimus superbus TaxID=310955 RepID=A0A914Z592_9BILA
MLKLFTVFVLFFIIVLVEAKQPSILVPLYIYPEDNAWQPFYNAIKNFSNVKFDVIVNVENGPGNGKYPGRDYIAGVAKLRLFSNVRIIGYVYTSYGKRSAAQVNADVNKYANWKSYTKDNIRIDGIFFDEVPEAANMATYLKILTGTNVPKPFYNVTDNIVFFESPWSQYSSNQLTQVKGLESKSSVIIHTFTGTDAEQQSTVAKWAAAGIASVYITTSADYDSVSSKWIQLCAAVENTKK